MALANVAWILASAGKKVLVVDWDLEAPGLHRYFRPFLTDPNVASSEGIIDFFTDYSLRAADRGLSITDQWCQEQADLDSYTTSLNWSFPGDGGIDFVPAGRQGPEYSTRVNTFDWKRLYERLRGSVLIEALRSKLTLPTVLDGPGYDYTLVDSRTGVSDTSGICTLQLPAALAACFTMNNQSIQGMQEALASIKRQRGEAKQPIEIYPLPMRIDLGEADRLEVRRKFARQAFEPFLPSTLSDQKRYWDETEVLGVPIYAYEEILAPFRDSGGAGSVLESYRQITRYLTGVQVDTSRLLPTDEQKNRILSAFAGIATSTELSLASKAEHLFQSFASEDREEFRRIVMALIRMVAPGKDELQTVSESDLKPKVYVLLSARDIGLLNVTAPLGKGDRLSSFQLADRDLLWSWPRLVDWLSRERTPRPAPKISESVAVRRAGRGLLHPERWGLLAQRYSQERPRKILALDGGGVRSIVTLQILHTIEQQLSDTLRAGVSFRLCDYFDYIGGTSSGAILAAGLALGMSVSEVTTFYLDMLPEMFVPSSLVNRVKSFYTVDPLKQRLQEIFGADTTLAGLKCLLLVVTKNATTDSPWTISSNPDAKYNDPDRLDNNLRIPLWQLLRASTAAPIYFPPEIIQLDPSDSNKTFVMVDGGMTPYNNPAFLLYRMATEPAYRLNWRSGESNLLIVSIGTGGAASSGSSSAPINRNILSNIAGIPGELMYGMMMDQDINCRTIGRCTYGETLDREVLDLVPRETSDGMSLEEQRSAPLVPLTTDLGRRFLYARYSVDLSHSGLDSLGLSRIDADNVQKMDAVQNVSELTEIGQVAGQKVNMAHFGPFIPLMPG